MEKAAKWIFFACACVSLVAVFAIVFFISYRSIPALQKVGVFRFLFGTQWKPAWEEKAAEGLLSYGDIFGVGNILATTLIVTAGAVLLGGAFGVFTATFTAFYCPKKWGLKTVFEQLINLLASIPSIIVGFFGATVVVPIVYAISPNGMGMGMLSAILVLALMITPTVASLSQNSLESVPREYYEGSLGVGATKNQTVFRVMLPSAKSGVVSSVVLGTGRAVGETMAVLFVIGGASGSVPDSFFKPLGSLTTTIAQELGEASFGSVHLSALTAIGLVLLVLVLCINLVLTLIKKERIGKEKRLTLRESKQTARVYRRSGAGANVLCAVSVLFAAVIAFAVCYLVGHILIKGLPYVNFRFLVGETRGSDVTIAAGLVTTVMTVFMTLLIALPLGIGAAIYLNEYSKKGGKLVRALRVFIDTLSGVPSIVFGLFGMIFFCQICGLGYCVLSGSLTMTLIVLPTVIRSTEESLREVPESMRAGALALGSSKIRTIWKIVLPTALRGIVTAVVLSIGRIVGESAALIYTSGAVVEMPKSYFSQGSTLSVFMYYFQCEGLHLNEMYATAVVLLAVVLALNVAILLLTRRKKLK